MAEEYLAYPGEHFPDEVYPFAATAVDDGTRVVHSPKGWEWSRVHESFIPDYAALVPDLIGATQETINTTGVPLSNITIAGGHENVSTAVVKEIWSKVVTAREGVFEKITADMIAANSITADMIQAGAIDGQVITGATIRTGTEGSRIELDMSGMRVYDSQNRKTLDIAENGNIEIFGRIGRKDSWSEAYFDDLVAADSGRDVANNGDHIGVGLAFTSTKFQKHGSISVRYAKSDNVGALMMAAPSVSGDRRPFINLAENIIQVQNQQARIDLYDHSIYMGGVDGKYSMSVSQSGISFRRDNKSQLYANAAGAGIATATINDPIVFTTVNSVGLGVSSSKKFRMDLKTEDRYDTRFWCDGVWVYGKLGANDKTFITPVPGLSEERGGKWLQHSCTESPWPSVEYWDVLTLGESGEAEYVTPTYYEALVRDDIPMVVIASGEEYPATAKGVMRDGRYVVTVKGTPGDRVSVLVKAGRHTWQGDVENGIESTDESSDPEDRWVNAISDPGVGVGSGPILPEEVDFSHE